MKVFLRLGVCIVGVMQIVITLVSNIVSIKTCREYYWRITLLGLDFTIIRNERDISRLSGDDERISAMYHFEFLLLICCFVG